MIMPLHFSNSNKAHHNQVNFHYQSKYSCCKINESDAKYSLVNSILNTISTENSHIILIEWLLYYDSFFSLLGANTNGTILA